GVSWPHMLLNRDPHALPRLPPLHLLMVDANLADGLAEVGVGADDLHLVPDPQGHVEIDERIHEPPAELLDVPDLDALHLELSHSPHLAGRGTWPVADYTPPAARSRVLAKLVMRGTERSRHQPLGGSMVDALAQRVVGAEGVEHRLMPL